MAALGFGLTLKSDRREFESTRSARRDGYAVIGEIAEKDAFGSVGKTESAVAPVNPNQGDGMLRDEGEAVQKNCNFCWEKLTTDQEWTGILGGERHSINTVAARTLVG